jgi:hypothetical protein
LLPYKKQVVIVKAEHITTLGIYACYPGDAWDDLALQALRNR